MANRRMFSKSVTNNDKFTEMPSDAQSLYFHLGMNADDEGFITPKGMMRMINVGDDALKLLIAKGFVIPFDSGILVISHWKENNYIQNDRFTPTLYEFERSKLLIDKQEFYHHEDEYSPEGDNNDLTRLPPLKSKVKPNVYKMDTQVRLGQDRIEKVKGEGQGGDFNKPLKGLWEEKRGLANKFSGK